MNPAPAAHRRRHTSTAPRRNPLPVVVLVLSLLFAAAVAQSAVAPGSQAATPLTVAQGIAIQNGSTAAVTGFVVGQPTAESTVLRSGFTADTAIAIADSAAETNTAKILYLQVTSAYRAQFGLQKNPSLMGRKIDVTGQLTAYFSHAGLKNPSAMAVSAAPAPARPLRLRQRQRPRPRPRPLRGITMAPPPARPAPHSKPACTRSSPCSRSSAMTRSGMP